MADDRQAVAADFEELLADAKEQVIIAAKQVHEYRDRPGLHLAGCTGPLSSFSCSCGLSDLQRAFQKLSALGVVRHLPIGVVDALAVARKHEVANPGTPDLIDERVRAYFRYYACEETFP